jgi:hypothetical protein
VGFAAASHDEIPNGDDGKPHPARFHAPKQPIRSHPLPPETEPVPLRDRTGGILPSHCRMRSILKSLYVTGRKNRRAEQVRPSGENRFSTPMLLVQCTELSQQFIVAPTKGGPYGRTLIPVVTPIQNCQPDLNKHGLARGVTAAGVPPQLDFGSRDCARTSRKNLLRPEQRSVSAHSSGATLSRPRKTRIQRISLNQSNPKDRDSATTVILTRSDLLSIQTLVKFV